MLAKLATTWTGARRRSMVGDMEATMKQVTFEAFEKAARAQGFDEVLERRWPPAKLLETHTHPFALRALVVAGEMWLTVGDEVRHLRPGDEFALDRDAPHAERYGPEGATYWVARRRGQ